jgi:hypothetical protein
MSVSDEIYITSMDSAGVFPVSTYDTVECTHTADRILGNYTQFRNAGRKAERSGEHVRSEYWAQPTYRIVVGP